MSKSTSVPYDIEIHYVLCYCVYCNIAVMIVIYICFIILLQLCLQQIACSPFVS